MLAEIAGLGLGLELASALPGGLWEVFMGGWLIVKGFSAPPVGAARTPSATTPTLTSPTVGGATT